MNPPPIGAIPGVSYAEGFLSDPDALFAWARAHAPWDDRIRARQTASYGVPYNYAGLDYPELPFPPELDRVRIAAGVAIGIDANNCLLNHYPDGRSRMGFHADDTSGLVGGVAIVSLGATRRLRFRRTAKLDERLDYVLAPGSLLYLPAAVHLEWQHALPRTSRPEPRISLTFRQVVRRSPQAA